MTLHLTSYYMTMYIGSIHRLYKWIDMPVWVAYIDQLSWNTGKRSTLIIFRNNSN